MAPLDLELANSIYHHIVWRSAAPTIALRHTATTKQQTPPGEQPGVMWDDRYVRRMRTVLKAGKVAALVTYLQSGYNPFLIGCGEGQVNWTSILLECMTAIAVVPDVNANTWQIPMIQQFDRWRGIANNVVLDALQTIRITGPPLGGTVYGNVTFFPDPVCSGQPIWNFFQIHADQAGLAIAGATHANALEIWMRICELLVAWRSGTIGCHQVYLRLTEINTCCESIIIDITGVGLNSLKAKNIAELTLLNDYVRRVLETKHWITEVRQLLDRALRMVLLGQVPSGCGNRWDVGDRTKNAIIHPKSPYSDGRPTNTGQEGIEAHCAIVLKSTHILKDTFRTVHRYVKKFQNDQKDADYWDVDGFPWDQKTAIDHTFVDELVGSITEKINGVSHLWNMDGSSATEVGIIVDATYCSLQFYERAWEALYQKFDIRQYCFLRKADDFPLFIDCISTNVICKWAASEGKGLNGMLLNFNLRLAVNTITFDSLCEFAVRMCSLPHGQGAKQRFKLHIGGYEGDDEEESSWTWHRDRWDAIPLANKGMFFEYSLKYTADYRGEAKCRLLINWTARQILVSPVHYNPFVVCVGERVTERASMFLVTNIPNDFWDLLQ